MQQIQPSNDQPLFPTGRTLATPGALAAIAEAEMPYIALLRRHVMGDWQELDDEDRATNVAALTNGARILSSFTLPSGVRVWIITEADRAATTILLPEEY